MKVISADHSEGQRISTPDELAAKIVGHFKPTGKILEPCAGDGAFLRAMPNADWCEISKGRDFFKSYTEYDWIVTNPPFSMVPQFLKHSMRCAKNIVFLCWAMVFFTKKRRSDMLAADFGIVEMLFVPTPLHPWPQSGFSLAATLLVKGYRGPIITNELTPK